MDSKAYVMILGQIELVEVVNLYYLILTIVDFFVDFFDRKNRIKSMI